VDRKLNDKQKNFHFNSEVIPHMKSLRNYALMMTRDYDNSEDLLQDTLLNAFRFLHKYEEGSNIKAWLFKIMKNSFINKYRKKIKKPFEVDYGDVLNFYEIIKPKDLLTEHFQQDAFSNSLHDEVENAVSLLPDDFRTIIFLSDIEGYTYKEISEFVDCPLGTVRSRLHRGRKILYSQLYNYARANSYLRTKKRSKLS